jgi:hypothetical protein
MTAVAVDAVDTVLEAAEEAVGAETDEETTLDDETVTVDDVTSTDGTT